MEPKLHEPVRTLPSVIGAPHAGHAAERIYRIYFAGAMEVIKSFLYGNPDRMINR